MILEIATICLALNLYHESRGEPLLGQIAVAYVTLNRADRDPAKVCDVVFEPYQFSWTDEKLLYIIKEPGIFQQNLTLAHELLKKLPALPHHEFLENATHYHADYVYPAWAKEMIFLGQIGKHLFYKERE